MSSFNVQSSQGPTSWGRVQAKSPTQVNSTSIGKVQTPVSSPTSDKVSYTAQGFMPKGPNAEHLGSLPMPQGPRFVPMQAQNQAAVKATHAFASQFPSHPPVVQASHQHAAPPPPSYAPPPPSYEETVRQTSTQKTASPAMPKETTTVKGAWTGGQEVKLTKEQNQVLMNTYLKSRAEEKVSSKNTQHVNTFNLSWSGKLNIPPPSYGADKIIEFSRLTPSEKVQAHADYLLNPNPPSTPTRADPLPKPQGHSYGYNTQEGEEEIHAAVPKSSPAETQRFDYTAPPPPSYSPQPPTSGKATTTHQGGWTGNTKVNLTSEQSQALMNKYQEKRSENNPRDAKAIQEFNSQWDERLKLAPPSFKGRPGSSVEFLALPREEQIKAHADYFQKEAAACKSSKSPVPFICPDAKWEKLSYTEKKIEFANITVIQNRKAAEAETTLADFLGGAKVAFTDREKDLLKSEIARIPSLLGSPPVTLTPTEYKKLTPEGQVQAHAKYLIDRDNFARSPQLPRELYSAMSQEIWESVSPSIRGGLFHTMNKSETDKRLPAIEGQLQFDYTAPPPQAKERL